MGIVDSMLASYATGSSSIPWRDMGITLWYPVRREDGHAHRAVPSQMGHNFWRPSGLGRTVHKTRH